MNALERAKKAATESIDRLAGALWSLSLEIHRDPEPSFQEHRACRRLCAFLEGQGFEVRRGVGRLPTAFQARRAARRGRPAVSFLSEYDALPGLGHACGHNVIGVASAGAGAALAQAVGPEAGAVVVTGTPAEEKGGGKVLLARRGLFRGLDAVMMFHPSGETRAEVNFLALAELRFRFTGRAAHASASPEKGINALDAVLAAFQAIAALRQHIPPGDRMHGIITEGGEAPNIIPARASAWFYVRSTTPEGLKSLAGRVEACARGAARATGARLRIWRNPVSYAPMRVNGALAALFRENLRCLGVREPEPLPPLAMGSSDVGNVSQVTPTIHPQIQMVPGGVSAHTPAFARAAGGAAGRKALLLGAKALAMTGADILLDAKARSRVRAEFERGGR